MRAPTLSPFVLVGLVVGLAFIDGCSSGDGGNHVKPPTAGAAGSSTEPTGTGAAGSTAGTGAAGSTAGTGAGGSTPGTGAAGSTTDGGLAGSAAGAPSTPPSVITAVWPTMGCGHEPGQELGMAIRGTVQTTGIKGADAADSAKGAWSYEREYFLTLPLGYEKTTAYPLILQAPGCGSTGLNVLPLKTGAGVASYSVDNTVIRVGLTPPPNAIGHATNLNAGCFDDKEGDDSVDWVFYENLYDKLSRIFCFDRNRVFAHGNSSGANFANELGCKYSGDADRPLRGVLVNGGGLPSEPQYKPTCTTKPMAGMWMQQVHDGTTPFGATVFAVNRALATTACGSATTYETAELDPFPLGTNFETSCKKVKGCSTLYPIVVCALPGERNYGNEDLQNVGFSAFLKLFETAPLLTP
jgi:hypothetical protein